MPSRGGAGPRIASASRARGACVVALAVLAATTAAAIGTASAQHGGPPAATRDSAGGDTVGTGRALPGRRAATPRALTPRDVEQFADSFFAPYLREYAEPSLAVVVVHRDSVVLLKGYGDESGAPRRAVDPESTLFNIASVSKLVTATAAMQLVERGMLSLDEEVTARLGRAVIRGAGPAVSLRHLLTHTSGLDGAFMRDVVASPAELVSLADYFARFPLARGREPGREIRYSNAGMALVGRLIEVASGQPFDRYVAEHVLEPLGMRRSTFRQPPPAPLGARVATHGSGPVPDALLLAPAGAMVSTAGDMGRFVRAHLDTGVGARRLLARGTLSRMHQPQWRAHPAMPGAALGFFTSDLGGVPGLFHTGARAHFSLLYLVPGERLGLFLVHAMRQGGPHQTLRTDFARALIERYVSPAEARLPSAAARDTATWPDVRAFVGAYRPSLLATTTIERAAQLGMDSRVGLVDGALTASLPGAPRFALRRVGARHFRVDGGAHAGLHVAFVDGAGGGFAMSGGTQDPLSFERLAWYERGTLHAGLLGIIVGLFASTTIAAPAAGLRRRLRGHAVATGVPRGRGRRGEVWAWRVAPVAGAFLLAGPALTVLMVLAHRGEDTAAAGLRAALTLGLTCILAGAIGAASTVPLAVIAWRREYWSVRRRACFTVLAAGALVAIPLLYHYRLLGYWL